MQSAAESGSTRAEAVRRLAVHACAAQAPARVAEECAQLRSALLAECEAGALSFHELRPLLAVIDEAEVAAIRRLTAVRSDPAPLEPSPLEDAREESSEAESVRFREHFLGIVSHDLRNPLSAIVTSAELLLRYGTLDERQARIVGRIAASADRMTRMIADLLDFARTRLGGAFPIVPRRVDLGALTSQMVEELIFANPGRDVRIEAEGDLWGNWDPDRIAQVVSNLVGNAIDHSPEDVQVTVRLRGEAGRVTFETHNGGPPIPERVLPHIFEPGRRGDTRGGGLGLGLFIVQQIVLAHGGTIDARSSAREGTVFTAVLPRQGRRRPAP